MDRVRDMMRGMVGAGRGVPAGVQDGFPPAMPDAGLSGFIPDMSRTSIDGQPIGKKDIQEASQILKKYREGKTVLENTIIQNEKWYKMRHWDIMKTQADKNTNIYPTSGWLFNSLANKHADAMDNYPSPNILPREQSDERDAKTLSTIIPCVLEQSDFEETYSDGWWYKVKFGTVPYCVTWDTEKENGLGDISIKRLDLLNVYWKPGVVDINDSPNLFIVQLQDDEILHEMYPEYNQSQARVIDPKEYIHDDYIDITGKSLVVDWYYKIRKTDGRTVLHYAKFVGDTLLYSSENEGLEDGFYSHGKYPVVFDVLFPVESEAVGFGYINVMKDTQMYIDKLQQIILKNAYLSGKTRFLANDQAGINDEDFLDFERSIIKVNGALDDSHIKQIAVAPLPAFIQQVLDYKVNELKETSGNRDFSQGGTSGGVTAASAIAALQEAGNKLSRDMLKGSYRAYAQIIYLVIELIRQFYTEERTFRIDGEKGGYEFVQYSNAGLRDQPVQSELGIQYRRPIFDIRVVPQRSNPFNRLSQNQMAQELFGMGVFNPQMADQALGMLDMMDFEGKQKVVERVQQGQTLFNVVQQLQQQNAQLTMIVDKLTGGKLTGGVAAQPQQEAQPQKDGAKTGGASQVQTARQATQTAANNAQGGFAAKASGVKA